jgi:feruloyl esterase
MVSSTRGGQPRQVAMSTRLLVSTVGALLLAATAATVPLMSTMSTVTASCERLTSLALPQTTITAAGRVDAGSFAPASGATALSAPRAFCRVAATLNPSADSEIKIEVWMPAADWNGKLEAVGNGAFNGTIPYGAMLTALGRGYSAAGTDTGHSGGGASFGLGHPEKVIDFGWRAVHEMTVVSKQIVAAYYGAGPRFSYWNGCSAGGRQAMKEAQRFPADFDGIIAGAPGLDWTGRAAQAVHVARSLQQNQAARLTQADARLLHAAVLAACDTLDGVKDGVLEGPKRCTFDPAVLQCGTAAAGACLTPPQVETARLLYASQTNPKSSRAITGLERGSELGWTDLGWTASARATGLDQFRYLVFKDPSWEISRFNFPTDIVRAEETDADTINALDPNLAPFIDRGGKLIQYHGWSDPQISPASSAQYYQRVVERLGGASRIQEAYRLFMAPGMGHCGGGEGPNTFDMLTALEQWVEQGRAPASIIASPSASGAVQRTRPLCPFPQVAKYKGQGSTEDEGSFECRGT